MSKSTVHSIKLAYLKRLNEQGSDSSADEIAELPPKKRGQPLLLGKNMDEQLQLHLKKIRDQGEYLQLLLLWLPQGGS